MKRQHQPPRLATRLLHLFLRSDFRDDVTADLHEQFDEQITQRSLFRAKLDYWYQVLHYFRPFAIRRSDSQPSSNMAMYGSYFTSSFRNMRKDKLHTFINISGLAIGLSVAMLIALWIGDELGFNQQFNRHERIGQVKQFVTNNGEVQMWSNVPFPLSEELRKNYGADFSNIAMSTPSQHLLVTTEDNKFYKSSIFVEPQFTRIFDIDMIEGTRDASDQSSALLSRTTAKAYFGSSDCLGKIITIDNQMTVKVSGVYEDFPANSSFNGVDLIASWDLYSKTYAYEKISDPWRPNFANVFVELQQSSNFADASDRIRDAKLKNVNEFLAKKKPALFIHPMDRWHLYSNFRNGKEVGGRIQYVWLFGIVGIFVLVMACINFMNLSTARSEKRSKEVGIRKAIGSLRRQLVSQFLLESLLTTMISFVIALLMVQLLLPYFNEMAGKHISIGWTTPGFWIYSLGFCVVTGILAGSYPAVYLSSIRAISAIKGSFRNGAGASLPRKVMVTVQFSVSVVLIIGTITIFLQIQHAKDRAMGYDSNGLVAIPVSSPEIGKHYDAIKREIEENGDIIALGLSSSPPTETYSTSSGFDWNGKDPELSVDFALGGVGYDYGQTLQWEVVSGRDFSRDFPSDSTALIINESAAHFMKLDSPVGEIIRLNGQPLTIIGVISDMITNSPYDAVKPGMFYLEAGMQGWMIARLNPDAEPQKALASIERIFKTHDSEAPFNYDFVDDTYSYKFGNEERIGKLATLFASLAIFISCLGIFGLSSFMAEQRTKEIGVRKVLGASVLQVWSLMCREFVWLVAISSLVAIPIAYAILSSWLQGFNYRIGIPLWSFLVSILGTAAVMIITISWHTWKAARISPAKTLKAD